MEKAIYTLQEFMLHTETITYIIAGIFLVGILGFYIFLTRFDDE